jgi:hypothetical protein
MSDFIDPTTGLPIDTLTDEAYSAYIDELNCWSLHQDKASKAWAVSRIRAPVNTTFYHFRFDSLANAQGCLTWFALRAAIAVVKRELGPSPSTESGNPTSDAQLSAATTEEENQ